MMADVLRDVKIKQLPIMNALDMEAIMIIEDELDTKQIKVSTIMKYIDAMVNSKIDNKIIQEKIEKMDLAIDRINKLADSMEKAEAARVEEFNVMRQEYAEFLAKYQSIKDTWDNNIIPDYDASVANESERKSNERYRINEFANWAASQATMQDNENTRQTSESNRVAKETKRESAENSRIAAESDRVSKENQRVSDELARVTAEDKREDQEEYRVNNEKIRIANEEKRENIIK